MFKRHFENDKLRQYYEEIYQSFSIQQKLNKGPQIENYLASALQTLQHCVDAQPLTFAFRIDLRFPDAMPRLPLHENNEVLTRFFRHLRYELDRTGLKYPHNLRYIWAREQDSSDKPHYHLMLLLNKNAVDCIGNKTPDEYGSYTRQNMYHRIARAWLKAMGFSGDDPRLGQLVHIAFLPTTRQDWSVVIHKTDFYAMDEAMYMASYLCKAYTKQFGQGIRVFDTSRR